VADNRVRTISKGQQLVTSYDLLVRIADGLAIPRGLLGVASSEDASQQAESILDPRRDLTQKSSVLPYYRPSAPELHLASSRLPAKSVPVIPES
jgi:hypothetical protein